MKLIILLFCLMVGSLKSSPFSNELFDSGDDLIHRVTNVVNRLTNATVSSSTPLSTNIVNLWDLIPAEYRFLLLNQTEIQQLGYSLVNLPSVLKWSSLPLEVKNVLVNLFNNLSFLNLKFSDWSWVNSNTDPYASSTLYSLIPIDKQTLIPAIQSLTNQLSLDQLINKTALGRGFKDDYKRPINFQVTKLSKHKRGLSNYEKNPSFQALSNRFRNSPWSVVNQALLRAKILLKSYNF